MLDNEKINQTIRAILSECSQSSTPLDCLAEEIGKLPVNCGWSPEEVNVVTQTVLQMLVKLMRTSNGAPLPIA